VNVTTAPNSIPPHHLRRIMICVCQSNTPTISQPLVNTTKYTHTNTYQYTHTQTRTNTYKYIQIIQIHTKPYEKHTTHTNTYKYIQTYTCIHKHTDLHAYIPAYLHIHTCYSYYTCIIYIYTQYRIEYAKTKLCPVGVSYYTRRTTRGSRYEAPACASWPRFSGTILLGCPKFTWGFP
jgi:hypothetical protein